MKNKKNKQTQVKKNNKRKVLMGLLIPIGVLAATAAIVTPCVICCNGGIQVELSGDIPTGVKIKETHVEKGKDSTITLEIPDNKEIDTINTKIIIGSKELKFNDDYTVENNIIKIKSTAVDGNKISIKLVVKDKQPEKVLKEIQLSGTYKTEYQENDTLDLTVW